MSASTRRHGRRWPSPILAVALWTIAAPAAAQDAGAPPACPAVPIGRACQVDADCGPGGLCFEGVADGYCTVRRDLDCCPPGARRLAGLDVCVVDCAVDADCPARPARQCTTEGFCWGCLAPPADAPIGAACATDDDCGGAGCLTAVGASRVEGGVCTLDVPAHCCPPGTGPGLLSGQRFCLPACRVDADCGRAGWGCDHEALGVCRPGAHAPPGDGGVAGTAARAARRTRRRRATRRRRRGDGGARDGGARRRRRGRRRRGRRRRGRRRRGRRRTPSDGGASRDGAAPDDARITADARADGGARPTPRRPHARRRRHRLRADAGHGAAVGDVGGAAAAGDDGCDCRATSAAPAPGWLALLLLGLIRRRRRRAEPAATVHARRDGAPRALAQTDARRRPVHPTGAASRDGPSPGRAAEPRRREAVRTPPTQRTEHDDEGSAGAR
ncbi:MAG: hypothetical protein H6704_25335 [Myxococcales bacterium]|nr:hypothetical protein [Myxococcales bacterium]